MSQSVLFHNSSVLFNGILVHFVHWSYERVWNLWYLQKCQQKSISVCDILFRLLLGSFVISKFNCIQLFLMPGFHITSSNGQSNPFLNKFSERPQFGCIPNISSSTLTCQNWICIQAVCLLGATASSILNSCLDKRKQFF